MVIPFLTTEQIEAFILVLLRVSAIVVMIPVFTHRSIPVRVKGGLSLLVAVLVFPVVRDVMPSLSAKGGLLPMVVRMAGELMIGITIGFAVRFIFVGVQYAGEFIGIQMGFNMASVLDPMSNLQVSVISEMLYMMAMLVFLSINGHHIFITAIADSYRIVAPLSFHFSGSLMQAIMELSMDMFMVAIKISTPVVAVLLFTNLGLALIARTVPQVNILVVGFPIQIAVGLIFLGLTTPLFLKVLEQYFAHLPGEVSALLRLM
jgi:flagellar biosynthesis protein FliR